MPFFQNPFPSDFYGYWVLADRQASLDFKCPRNAGRGAENVTAWVFGPYELSGNDADGHPLNVLTLNFSTSSSKYMNWTAAPIIIGPTIPITFVGDGSSAFANAPVAGGVVQNPVTITNGGFGYGTSTTTAIIDGNTGTGATFTVTVTNGIITGCTVTNGGSGYNTPLNISASEIVGSLNTQRPFSDWFTASLGTFQKNPTGQVTNDRIVITQNQPQTKMRFFVSTGGAESVLQFNKFAGVAPLPAYFTRHTIGVYPQLPDSQNALIPLNPSVATQANVIDGAVDFAGNSLGYLHTSVLTDSQLLRGRSGLFMVTNNTTSGTSIVYQAGAQAGDMAKKIITSGTSTIEIPYTLTTGDILLNSGNPY